MGRDGGGAKVDGQSAEPPVVEARPDVDQAGAGAGAVLVDGDGDVPVALAQRGLDPAQDAERHVQRALPDLSRPLGAECGIEPFQIAGRLVHVGLGHGDVEQPGRRIHVDGAGRRRLADDLPVDLAGGRDVDEYVRPDGGLATQTTALCQPPLAAVAFLHGIPCGKGVGRNGQPQFGEGAGTGRHLAAGAYPPPAAYRVEIDAQGSGR